MAQFIFRPIWKEKSDDIGKYSPSTIINPKKRKDLGKYQIDDEYRIYSDLYLA